MCSSDLFNFLINLHPLQGEVLFTNNTSGWAVQLGTTKAAIEAGAGDIGMIVKQDPSRMDEYIKVYKDTQPIVKDSLVYNDHVAFTIVHQWDRVPAIKELVMKKYG